MKIIIYILTYDKKITQEYDNEIYKPLVCGAVSLKETHDYLCDNTGENISDLNKYYAEVSGEYWAWKNSDADIIGFCHYRRWFVKNFKFDKLTKKDILETLKTYDIILPLKRKFVNTQYESKKNNPNPEYDVKFDDYYKIEKVLNKYYPDYEPYYKNVMNGHYIYSNNMFICKRELANEYFEWLFDVLKILENEIDLNEYSHRDTRVFGFISERLLTTFVLKNNLKIKEFDLYCNESQSPYIYLINCRYPKIQSIEYKIYYFFKKYL